MQHRVKSPLAEKFWDGVKTQMGYAEVFQNPTSRELGELIPENVGLLVTHRHAYFWDRTVAYHATVIAELKIRGGLPLLADFDKHWDSYDCYVSDTVRGSEFDHSPRIREFLEEHPFMSRYDLGTLGYWDEPVVGRWEDAVEDEPDFGEDEDSEEWLLGGYTEPTGSYYRSADARRFLGGL